MVNESLKDLCLRINSGQIRAGKKELALLIDSNLINKLESMSAGQFAWHVINDTWVIPTCKMCNNEIKFNNHRRKYAITCSKACNYANPDRVINIANTMKFKYGVTNAAHSSDLMEKKKQTFIKNFGVDHPSKSPSIKLQKKNTMLDNWGVDNPSKSVEIQQRKIKTNQEKRGVDWATQDPDVIEKQRKTTQEHWGVNCSLNNSIIREKANKTMLEKYGVINPQQNEEIKLATKITNLEKYGVPYPWQNEEIKDKITSTNLERYGAKSWLSSEIGQKELCKIHLNKRGYINPSQDPVVQAKIKQTMLEKYGVSHINYINMNQDQINAITDPILFSNAILNLTVQMAANKLGVNDSTIYRLSKEYNCRSNLDLTINTYECKVTDLLNEIGVKYLKNSRRIIPPLELDIYLPDNHIAIETGSIYWHGEQFNKNSQYHFNKWKRCKDLQIDLFQWFDDDLHVNWHIVKSKLLRSLGISLPIIGARKLSVGTCDVIEEREFLNKWHVKGFSNNRNVVIASKYNDQIISIMTLNVNNNICIIDRWATDINISWPGAFSKSLSYWLKKSNFKGEIRTWCDNRLGNGKVYKSSGFNEIRVSKPGYWYFKYNGLEHRSKYQRNKLIKMFNLDVNDTRTEWEIMKSQGYDRLWDAGHTLWTKIIY
jgi:hypothetical protein